MGDVLEFPSQQAQALAYLERQLSLLLRSKGADEQLIAFATAQLSDIYSRVSATEQYGFSVELPDGLSAAQCNALEGEINTGLQSIHRANHALLLELVAQLLLAKVRLFQQQRPG
tara:strand:+ start:3721 stop:4065 length:345 start_codon:yes stop_codon:yes gene_type:complete